MATKKSTTTKKASAAGTLGGKKIVALPFSGKRAPKKVAAKKPAAKVVAKKKEATASGPRGRLATIFNQRITAKKFENDRSVSQKGKGTGYDSFAIVVKAGKKGITVGDFVAAGGRMRDARWDEDRGALTIK